MTDIIIKQAQENDIPIIEEIMFDVVDFLDTIGQPQWERQNVSWQGLSRYFKVDDFYIASINNNPVGCFALIDYDPTFWPDVAKGTSLFIHKLAVKRCGSKQGVSKALIDFAKTQAVKLGINEVRLDTHQFRTKVRAIYEHEGFICVGEKCLYEKYHTAFYVWKAKYDIIHTIGADGSEKTEKPTVFYHASNTSGLLQLEPLSIMHGNGTKVCYFTPNKVYALFYLRDMGINHVTCGVSDDGVVVYHEQFPRQLEVLYMGRSGTIYHCDGKDITEGHTKGVWVAVSPITIKREEHISNVYEDICEAERLGKVHIIRYQTLSEDKKSEITEMMKNHILKNRLLESQSPKAVFMRTYFPDSWKLAEEVK